MRSKIPEIIGRENRSVVTHCAEPAELWCLLCDKLGEETRELREAKSREEAIEEVADLLEVLDAVQRWLCVEEAEVQQVKAFKLTTRGAFDNVVLHPPYHGVSTSNPC